MLKDAKESLIKEQPPENEQEFIDLFNNATVGIHFVSPDGIIQQVNRAELDLLGYSREEYVGRHIADFYVDQNEIDDILEKLSAGEELDSYEARMRCKDGSVKYVIISSNVLWEDGEFIHTRCFTRDITERKKSKEAQYKSEQNLQFALEAGEIGSWEWDIADNTVIWSGNLEAIHGMDEGEFDGNFEGFIKSVHPDDRDRLKAKIQHAIDDDSTYEIEHRWICSDGDLIWLKGKGKVFRNEAGKAVRMSGICMDITNRKRTELLHKEQKEILEAIASGGELNDCLSSVTGAISRLDPGVRASIMLADDQGEKFKHPIAPDFSESFGQGLKGGPINDLAIGTCGEAVFKNKYVKSRDIENDDKWSKEWRALCIGHDIRACFSSPIKDKDGKPVGSLMICFDEPREPNEWEQRLAEFGTHIASVAIERNRSDIVRERFRAAVEIDTVGVLFWSEDYKITEVNDAFLKMSGFRREEAIGLSWQELTPQEFQTVSEKAVRELNIKGRTAPYEKQYIRKDGSRWWGLFAPRRLKSGEIAEFVIDVTKGKQAEEELKEMNETLEERVEERTSSLLSYQKQLRSLASQLSKAEEDERRRLATELHDNLGQMLAVAKMKVDLMQNTGSLSDLRETSDLMDDAIGYTRELMSELKPPPSLGEEDISTALQWLAKKMKKYNLNVTFNGAEPAESLDEDIQTTLVQSVRELLFNVVKHADAGEACIVLSYPGDHLKITVEDDGAGFDLAKSDSELSKERGFGLFNIRDRIDLLGGAVDIESEPGKGTKVELLVPLTVEGADALSRGQDGRLQDQQDRLGKEGLQKIKVLLVDDHEMMREGLKKIIEQEKDLIVTAEAPDGQTAVKLAHEVRPDVIIMDINLPGMNGIDATQKIKSELPEMRVIGLSLHNDEDVIKQMRDVGASAYLTKSEAFETLCATIRSEGRTRSYE